MSPARGALGDSVKKLVARASGPRRSVVAVGHSMLCPYRAVGGLEM